MRNEGGFALIAALWLIVAMSALGVELSLRARDQRLATVNAVRSVHEQAAADAGIEHARARLTQLIRAPIDEDESVLRDSLYGPSDPWHRPGRLFPDTVRMGDIVYRVSLQDAGAGLNLNRASESELRRLLGALRVDFGKADRLAQAIADWRDPDDDPRARGAEKSQYLRESGPVLPRNGPFQSLEELRSVRGMDDDVYRRLVPHLRLLGTGRINLNSAEREVLLALEGMSEEAVAVIARTRRSGNRLASLDELNLALPPSARSIMRESLVRLRTKTTVDTREVEVVSEAWVPGGQTRSRLQGLFVRSDNDVILAWRRRW